MALATLSIDLTAKTAQLERDMREAAKIGQKGTQQLQDSFAGLKSFAADFLVGMAAGMAAAFSVGAITQFVAANVEAADELNRLSQSTGVSVEKLSQWGAIAKRNGLDVSDLAEQINELQAKLADTSDASEGTGYALKQLGIDYKALKKLSSEDAFTAVAEALSKVEDSGKKAALAMAVGGDEYQKYLPVLNAIGAGGLAAAAVTDEQAKAAARYKDSLTALSIAGDSWSQTVVGGIIPALDEAVRALIDVTRGTDGLTAEARALARDGTITDWARASVTALTYLADAGSVITRAFRIVGQTIGADLAIAGEVFGTLGTAARLAIEGEYGQALDAVRGGMARVTAINADASQTLNALWSEETLGAKIRARIEDIRAVGTASTAAASAAGKIKLKFDPGAQKAAKQAQDDEKKQAEAQKKALEEYEKLVTGIRTKTAADEAEAQGLAPLTEAQRSALEVMTQIRDGRLKLTDAQKVNITGYLDEALAAETAATAAKAHAAWMDEARGLNVDVLEQTRQQTAGITEQLAAMQLQAEEFGLGAEALEELARRRQLDTARALEARAAAMDGLDSHAELTTEWRRQADAIRELVQRRQDLAALEKRDATDPMRGAAKGVRSYIDGLQEAGRAAKDFAGQSLKSIEDALVSVATGGEVNWKSLVNSMLAEAARLAVIRPMMQNLLGDGATAAGWIGKLAGGGSKGGMDSFNSWEFDAGIKSGGGSGLGDIASWVTSLFGRATGGGVTSGSMYQVNERGPELLTVGGRSMLMMGDESGSVTPLQAVTPVSSSPSGGAQPVIHQTFQFGGADTVTRAEMQRAAADAKAAALAEWRSGRSRGVPGYA